ncbi:very-long-chain (3R)-3-hydroxyacyl-CoA dehydratase [Gouania willdenowi]|uniref:very-long-chain (3R)-3-hydroxyacyl-CoA dehydratase n=1 Tax=Gouania willdenowi TaxID=441366 RepID=UPI001055DCFA|nr:very-long-chain (3R)-3-hydroxyacyl-CoA dehydratase 3 [Gouania willdenowi]
MELCPLVHWDQNQQEIYLRVELSDPQNVNVHVHEKLLQFSAQGHGAQGQNEYKLSLDFLLPVKPEVSHASTHGEVNITIQKKERGWWERLTEQDSKALFLEPDYQRWQEEPEADAEVEGRRMKALKHTDGSLKTGYLFVYNLVQFVGFSWLFVNMTVRVCYFGEVFLHNTYVELSDVMSSCQILATLEVLHGAFGVVRTSVVSTLVQVEGRSFILFVIFGILPEMQHKPVVFFVFYLWSAVEIFRYPFYMLACLNKEWKALTWLRYSVWIPLGPLAFLAESAAVVESMPLFDVTPPFSVPLITVFGRDLRLSHFLYLYMSSMILGLWINFRHLRKQRRLHTEKRKTN